MKSSLDEIINSYDPNAPLAAASTIPAAWYTNEQIFQLEQRTVFNDSWHFAARREQLVNRGDFVTTEIAGEPIVLVRGNDDQVRGFFNVCRHHAAAIMSEPEGRANQMRCPYHGWTYSLAGELKGTPDFAGVCDFDRAANGLLPIAIAAWGKWFFVKLNRSDEETLDAFLGSSLLDQFQNLSLPGLKWFDRRRYVLNCNWKVFVDNYLDGGYHVPHLHKGLDSVLDYSNYTIENGERFCLQSSPMAGAHKQNEISSVRAGKRALYYWIFPNFMINFYEGTMDTNLVRPLTLDYTEVIFDFYFSDVSEAAHERNRASVDLGEQIQQEDVGICESVQRGLKSRAYQAGRLSVRREAGEQLFHRLLYQNLRNGIEASAV